jgi:hypothetical protein
MIDPLLLLLVIIAVTDDSLNFPSDQYLTHVIH